MQLAIRTILLVLFINIPCYANNSPIINAKQQLQHIESKIISLKNTLHTSKNKQNKLLQELAKTEKNINATIRRCQALQTELNNLHKQISSLQRQDDGLNQQLQTQRQRLSSLVLARYKMGENTPLKIFLNHDDASTIEETLIYYKYILQTRQKLITDIKTTQQEINNIKHQLNLEHTQQQKIFDNLALQRAQLTKAKTTQTKILQSLNIDIKNTNQKLDEYQRNKTNLTKLLANLLNSSKNQQSLFYRMRHKLSKPLNAHPQKWNQGIIFYAPEGTAVQAVYSGQVIFSDWLRGYGMLLIIDHGRGFMTLYAHNQALFKHKGETVIGGENIARVGHTGGIRQNGLYFEIRQGGKTLPPLDWLS